MYEPLRLLISAYDCRPGEGSEPGIGWNWAEQAARFHRVWVITRARNRPYIEEALRSRPLPQAQFFYFDLPRWASFWHQGRRGVHIYYYLWQLGAWFLARRLHRRVHFDAAHHVTLGCYWMPSFLALLPIPYVWGPVGGGESGPRSFWRSFGLRGKVYEVSRDLVRLGCRLDPFVRLTARRARVGLAATRETEQKMQPLGCRHTVILAQAALPVEEVRRLRRLPLSRDGVFRVLSVGALVHWKGFALGLRAFAAFRRHHPHSEYWLVGDGPERPAMEVLARDLALGPSVRFFGELPRPQTLAQLAACDVLLHPSLHDSGGWVCLEAMAAGRPVVCLDLGGPALMVSDQTGIKVPALSPEQAVGDLAAALSRLAADPQLCACLGGAAQRRVESDYTWDGKGELEQAMCALAAEAVPV